MIVYEGFLFVFAALAVSTALAAYVPSQENLTARRSFAEKRFGIFIHWGLYSNYAQGEWYLQRHDMRESDYAQMMHGFYPSRFDAKRWVKCFKDAGARYVTITSRHHDGFSLWPSKVDDGYNIANTPFKRDILGELAMACKEEGIQLNFYYSLMDWHRADYPTGREWRARKTLKVRDENYASYKKFMMGQLTELLDNYQPGVIWFDGEWDHDPRHSHIAFPIDWEFDDIYDLIHSKGALVFNNHHHDVREKEDVQVFEGYLPGDRNRTGYASADNIAQTRPLEQCDVIQEGVWGYKVEGYGTEFKSAEEVVAMVARAAGRGVNLLMNIGPRADGSFPDEVVTAMKGVGKWFERNGESIYGTSGGNFTTGADIVTTRKGDVLYLHFINPEATTIAFRPEGRIVEAQALWGEEPVSVEMTSSGQAVVRIVRPKNSGFDCVVRVSMDLTGRSTATK